MKSRRPIALLRDGVEKVELLKNGVCVAAIWRRFGKVLVRGRIPEKPYVALILNKDGTIEEVPAKQKTLPGLVQDTGEARVRGLLNSVDGEPGSVSH